MRQLLLFIVLFQLFVSFMTWFLKTSFVIGSLLGQAAFACSKLLARVARWLWRTAPSWFGRRPPNT